MAQTSRRVDQFSLLASMRASAATERAGSLALASRSSLGLGGIWPARAGHRLALLSGVMAA